MHLELIRGAWLVLFKLSIPGTKKRASVKSVKLSGIGKETGVTQIKGKENE